MLCVFGGGVVEAVLGWGKWWWCWGGGVGGGGGGEWQWYMYVCVIRYMHAVSKFSVLFDIELTCSITSAKRFIGMLAFYLSEIPNFSLSIASGSNIGVTVNTGHIAFTLILFFAYSIATVLVIPITACLLAE